ncbi:DUF1778 domain-containing protein [Tomitella cavernea]|uniref:DUF1778 domain-containing protein n=1 Tax=Tomitella cavernea TaxID=1387982 RepID=A0ABP9CF38_9ACTN|nr:DUF1778 domain-containing protein [Tomitella cavernea]
MAWNGREELWKGGGELQGEETTVQAMQHEDKSGEAAGPVEGKRDRRLSLRTTARQSALIQQAAASAHKTVSEFVLDSATDRAEDVLAGRRHFAIGDIAWQAFHVELDRPAVLKPRLRALLHEDPPFEPQA